jgi:hypothetical protein
MKRRTFAEVARAAVLTDRGAVLAFAAAHCREIDALCVKNRITAGEADMLKRRVAAFAEQVGQGLHA